MEFQSHRVVTSQSMNKKFGAPTPSCFVYNIKHFIKTGLGCSTLGPYPGWLSKKETPYKELTIKNDRGNVETKENGTCRVISLSRTFFEPG